jgi:hypothetical protein
MEEIINKALERYAQRNMDLSRPSDREIIAAEINAMLRDNLVTTQMNIKHEAQGNHPGQI